jgi:hypothetical protein
MSTQFLRLLDSQRGVNYSAFLSSLENDARIAWYPSGGTDFRALFYLDNAFLMTSPTIEVEDPKEPDIFLYTDYALIDNTFEKILFHGGSLVIHDDGRAKVTLSNIEDLGRIDFESYPDYRLTEENKHFFNRVFFFNATIESADFGSITKPILYAFCCNEQICSELLLPVNAKISHIVHVRYGHGFGGGNSSGHWIQHVLNSLQCEMYIHDGLSHYYENEHKIISYYSERIPQDPLSILTTIREIDGRGWSNSTRIIWQSVKRNPEISERYLPERHMRFRRLDYLVRGNHNSHISHFLV